MRLLQTGACGTKQERNRSPVHHLHVVFAEAGQLPRSYAARSRDTAIQTACELLAEDCDVRRILDPNGGSIERAELDEHYDARRFPGLCIPRRSQTLIAAQA